MPLTLPIGKKHVEVQCFNCRIEPAAQDVTNLL
jgi:hypothetical protein